jgi:cytochrome b
MTVTFDHMKKIKVWDLSTRLWHWSLVIIITVLAISGLNEQGSDSLHQVSGLVLMALIGWRIIWGIWGSESSRFIVFLKAPLSIWQQRKIKQRHHIAGHSPLAGYMVLALILTLSTQIIIGFLLSDFSLFSELLPRSVLKILKEIHSVVAYTLFGLIALHIAAILLYQSRGYKLVQAMISGWQLTDLQAPTIASTKLSVVTLLLSLTSVVVLIAFSWFI